MINIVKFFDHGQKQHFTLLIYIFELGQKYLNTRKERGQNIFELADEIGSENVTWPHTPC